MSHKSRLTSGPVFTISCAARKGVLRRFWATKEDGLQNLTVVEGSARLGEIMVANFKSREGVRVVAVLAVLLLEITASTSRAQVTNLQAGQSVDLANYVNVPGAGILVGDKLFNDFSYIASDSTGLTNNLLPSGAVTLSALSNMVGFGLSFGASFHTSGNLLKDFVI